ncbi:DksA/TraR family C4-type zinc finger protein [Pasteurella atlantica]|uniref:DksA/TraR family C4-type zinc finger protein n=3 Tax=Pasteurellales TaxID=135625 RepID=A0ACC6HKM3_9PAST|nr:DksA/TraR family C4-type zinc finger protein [Pasteurella atlantica]MDP8051420.1 DksA/TraR family C4-type zinc finger protein [Pasteurella atlantica]MDP8057686.1 DksA/TraR family C4-type zinc finger protein [Pasteurella atlantica]MDP8059748.1 DksA/TraR family C4-type zinc finger protein [Pasteurella atlantica]MDP8063672.1 DksA/TraR family C4-type zinc finger protein [Pasteurella atlantica]
MMAGGWSQDGAVQEQIDASINDAIKSALNQLPKGESAEFCDECGDAIPQARRQAIQGVRLCIHCQEELEIVQRDLSTYNRRGSKDSQLR